MTTTKCFQCGKYFETSRHAYVLRRMDDDGDAYIICGLNCLTEICRWPCTLEPKLSKSSADSWDPITDPKR